MISNQGKIHSYDEDMNGHISLDVENKTVRYYRNGARCCRKVENRQPIPLSLFLNSLDLPDQQIIKMHYLLEKDESSRPTMTIGELREHWSKDEDEPNDEYTHIVIVHEDDLEVLYKDGERVGEVKNPENGAFSIGVWLN